MSEPVKYCYNVNARAPSLMLANILSQWVFWQPPALCYAEDAELSQWSSGRLEASQQLQHGRFAFMFWYTPLPIFNGSNLAQP
jgi:hypothetical protein